MNAFTLPIPTYQCHKRVQALRIKDVVYSKGFNLHFEDDRFCPMRVSGDWYRRYAMNENGPRTNLSGGYLVIYKDGYMSWSPAAAFEAGYTLVETVDGAVRQDASQATLSVKVGKMVEGNGRVTWSVLLAKSPDAAPWDCHQVYSDAIEGRVRYEAAVLAHFLGLGPAPDILEFDTDPPAEEVRPVSPAPDWSAWPGGPSEVEAALASRDAEIERLRAKLDENAMPDDYILIADQLASERLEKNRLREALALAEGVALRVIAETGFDESKVADWRPVVRDALENARSAVLAGQHLDLREIDEALRHIGPATQAAREAAEPSGWRRDLVGLRYAEHICGLFESMFDPWMTESDKDQMVREVLELTGVTLKGMDEEIQVGVDNGYSPEHQMHMARVLFAAREAGK